MRLKDYLAQKPTEEYFDVIPSVYKSRDVHDYENNKIKIIRTDLKNPNRKIILLEEE